MTPYRGWGRLLLLLVTTALWTPVAAKLEDAAPLARDWQQALARGPAPRDSVLFPHGYCFKRAANRHGVAEALLLAVARGESDFEATAKSRANAIGVMQIRWPQTAKHLGIYRLSALYDPCSNIDAGARYLKELLQRYRRRTHLALAAYNYGPGRIPVDARRIPDGALWYSRYILRHYAYVTGTALTGSAAKGTPAINTPSTAPIHYREERKLELIRFDRPYRAEAFVKQLRRQLPELQLDWFRLPDYQYKVVARYQSNTQLQQIRSSLQRAGIRIL